MKSLVTKINDNIDNSINEHWGDKVNLIFQQCGSFRISAEYLYYKLEKLLYEFDIYYFNHKGVFKVNKFRDIEFTGPHFYPDEVHELSDFLKDHEGEFNMILCI